MMFRLMTITIALVHTATAFPAITLKDLEVDDDTLSVGSYVRETRAAPPENFHKSYQSEGDGDIGYSRKKNGGGKKGYQHFDSFHKKAGDNYEFEKQDSYGLDDGGKKGGHSHEHERNEDSDSYDDEGAYSHNHERKAESYREPESEDIDEDHQRRPAKKDKGRHQNHEHEELKEGANDGNGGVEAYGHNPDDYALPEKYTYGSGEEYNF